MQTEKTWVKSGDKILSALIIEVLMGWSEGIDKVSSTWSSQEKYL